MTRGWLSLGAASIGVAALLALALVAMRLPGVAAPLPDARAAFGTALALHVNLATYVWIFACAAAFWGGPGLADKLAFTLAGAGVATLLASPLAGSGSPVLSNYVPVLDQAPFIAGLSLFGAGIVLAAFRAMWQPGPGIDVAPRAAPLTVLCAFGVLGAALAGLPADVSPAGRYEAVFWGFGHVLQVALVLVLMCSWRALAARSGGRLPLLAGAPEWLTVAALLPAAWLVWTYPVASNEYRDGFTQIMRWGSWPGALWLGVLVLWRLRGARADRFAAWVLRASIALFVGGLIIGAVIRPGTTLVPAHYHGTVGALTFALLAHVALLAGTASNALLRRGVLAYGAGTAVLILALAAMGLSGAPRKTPGLPDAGAGVQAILVAAGGAVAVAGALLCAVLLLRALAREAPRLPQEATTHLPLRRMRDVRLAGIAATIAAVAVGGALFGFDAERSWPAARATGTTRASLDPAGHSAQRRSAEVQARFTQAVMMLHARQYEHAVAALHRLLELAPEMPEVHVNMGYAMLGLERPGAARDFFEGATTLRPGQANAYYGLAVSLARLGDVEGALGSMRTYVHLSPPDDPYAVKARASIAEWEKARKR